MQLIVIQLRSYKFLSPLIFLLTKTLPTDFLLAPEWARCIETKTTTAPSLSVTLSLEAVVVYTMLFAISAKRISLLLSELVGLGQAAFACLFVQ